MKNNTKLPSAPAIFITLLLMLSLCQLLWASTAEAHPHVFMDCSLTFEFDSNGLKGVRQKWWFDEMFAAMILTDYDKDQNRKLSAEEKKAIENGAFINLKNFNYFTVVMVDGKRLAQLDAVQFDPAIEDGTLVYTFFVPLKLDKRPHQVQFTVYDESFYTAIQIDPQNKVSSVPEGMKVQLTLEPVPEMAYFYDQMVPEAAVLKINQ